MSAPLNRTQAKTIDHTVKNVIASMSYRDYQIIQTDDPNLVGQADAVGFRIREGFVVRDAFGDPVFPIGMSWFYTPYDAISAVEMLDTILPQIKEGQPATSLQYEWGLLWQHRLRFHLVYATLVGLRAMCDEATTFGDDTIKVSDLSDKLHLLRQSVAQARGGVL